MRRRYIIYMLFLCLFSKAQNLSLHNAIGLAQQQSYDAMVAHQSFLSKYWSYRSYRAELLPSMNLSGNLFQFNRSMVEARSFDDGRISYVENNSLTNRLSLSIDQNVVPLGGKLSVQSYLNRLDQLSYDTRTYNSQPIRLVYTQPLRAFNSLKWKKKTEPLKYEQAKRAYMEAMEDIAIKVVQLYFDVLSAQSLYQQSCRKQKDREYLYDIAKKRFEIGKVNKSEILQMELSVLNAQVEVSNNLLSLNTKRFGLFSYLRVVNYEGIELQPPYSVPNLNINADDVVSKALANSTHTLSQKVSLLESQKAVALAKAQRGLQMQINGEVALNRTSDNFSDAYHGLKDNEIAGVTFSLPIFDWGVSRGRVRMARADLEVTKAKLEQAHETYLQDLRTYALQFSTQAMQCRIALRAQDIADERNEITKQRFETGAVTVTDLNTAQQESESAKAQYIRILQTFWRDYYTIRKVTLFDWVSGHDLDVDFDNLIRR